MLAANKSDCTLRYQIWWGAPILSTIFNEHPVERVWPISSRMNSSIGGQQADMLDKQTDSNLCKDWLSFHE